MSKADLHATHIYRHDGPLFTFGCSCGRRSGVYGTERSASRDAREHALAQNRKLLAMPVAERLRMARA